MLKNSKDFKRKVFSDITKAKVMTLKIVAAYAIINSIALIGGNDALISVMTLKEMLHLFPHIKWYQM